MNLRGLRVWLVGCRRADRIYDDHVDRSRGGFQFEPELLSQGRENGEIVERRLRCASVGGGAGSSDLRRPLEIEVEVAGESSSINDAAAYLGGPGTMRATRWSCCSLE